MVTLTRLDGHEVVVNADHILSVEKTPDTKLVLTNGAHLLVKERVAEVVERVAEWQRAVARPLVLGEAT